MPAAASNRAPIILLLVVVLGIATRVVRDRGSEASGLPSVAALDSQLSRVAASSPRGKGSSARPKRSTRSKTGGENSMATRPGRAPSGRGDARAGTATAIRSERTPFGALPPEVLAARERDSVRAAAMAVSRRLAVRRNGAPRRSPAIDLPPPSRSAPLDLDTAPAEEIERLPRIGPALARRIVEDRQANGAFGSLTGLQRVRGIGPATAALIRGRVTFTGARRP